MNLLQIHLSILLVLSQICTSSSSVFLYETRIQYESLPASFGMRFEVGREYSAHLQKLDDNPYLCDDEPSNVTSKGDSIVVPTDGMPVALLAKRGQCSYEKKARTAMAINPIIQYVLIYDDQPGEDLKTMTATDPSGLALGLQFISNSSGKDILLNLLKQSATAQKTGGLRILMDCYTPWLYPNGWVGWIMMLISCLGSFLLCISTGFIRRDGTVIIVGSPLGEYETLLSDEDVDNLPDTCYCAESEYEIATCSICLEEFEQGETLKMLPCHHSFHDNCIRPWLTERHATCPLCKQRVPVFGEEETLEVSDEENITPGASGTSVTIEYEDNLEQADGRTRGWFHVPSPFNRRASFDRNNDATIPLLEENN